MKSHSIVITDPDLDCLTSMIRDLRHSRFRDCQQLDLLEQTLQSADVRPQNRMPRSVIEMNSTVCLCDVQTRKEEVYTLVLPHRSNASRGLISILAPVGIAMIGHRKRDIIEVTAPGGPRKFRIEQVTRSPKSSLDKKLPPERRISTPSFTLETNVAA